MDEKEKFYVDQKLKLNTEILKILSVAVLATITGVLSLIIQQSPGVLTGKSMMLMFFGFVLVVIFSILAIFVYRDNLKMLKNIKQ
ncbi:MAG TPA: hypothetical protein VIN08_26475 [Ohtaekwangia sp.]|uniref:hypothetical protein n=1 Tax=Ohtaekwangia sp. TaxID=2066019 RepID=UPI002F9267FD